jgi:hypothetical protein
LEKNLVFWKKGQQGTEGICIKILKGEFIRNFGPNSTVGLVRERIFWHKNIMWQHCCNDKRHSMVYIQCVQANSVFSQGGKARINGI